MREPGRPTTSPALATWPATGPAFRREERTARVRADEPWESLVEQVLTWGVKTRSGFAVEPAVPVKVGDRPVITARLLGVAVREPVEVVEVVREADRAGFAYRTLPGHPVDGEEAFVLHRGGGGIRLTVRSLTRPAAHGPWRPLHPALLVAQAVAHRRYLRALG